MTCGLFIKTIVHCLHGLKEHLHLPLLLFRKITIDRGPEESNSSNRTVFHHTDHLTRHLLRLHHPQGSPVNYPKNYVRWAIVCSRTWVCTALRRECQLILGIGACFTSQTTCFDIQSNKLISPSPDDFHPHLSNTTQVRQVQRSQTWRHRRRHLKRV